MTEWIIHVHDRELCTDHGTLVVVACSIARLFTAGVWFLLRTF
jgi:hypothetical protein